MASAERHVVAQPAFLALRPGGGEDLVLDEVEDRLRLGLPLLSRFLGLLSRAAAAAKASCLACRSPAARSASAC